jgi:hypothetical protein
VFLCHAPEDRELRVRLEGHLALLVRGGAITLWHEERAAPGEPLRSAVAAEIDRADVILLLVSASFLQSDDCYEFGLKKAMRRHARREALAIPILLRPVAWEGALSRDVVSLPRNGLAVTLWRDMDEAFREIVMGIRDALAARAAGLPFGSPRYFPPAPASSDARRIDAAVPARVVVREPTQVLAVVATSSSDGLRAVLRVDDSYAPIAPEDVRSSDFKLEFPVDAHGCMQPATVTIALESPEFDPPFTVKKILVPPAADSTVCALFVTPVRAGTLPLQMEVRLGDVTVWSLRLRTTAAGAAGAGAPSYVLASLPLSTVSLDPRAAMSLSALESHELVAAGPLGRDHGTRTEKGASAFGPLLDFGKDAGPLWRGFEPLPDFFARASPDGSGRPKVEPGDVPVDKVGPPLTPYARSIDRTGGDSSGARRKLAGFLVSFQDDPCGKFWPLREGRNVVGRAPEAHGVHVQILHARVSRVHAVIECRGDRVTVQDLGSAGGTFLHERALEREVASDLKDRDHVRFGPVAVMVVLIPASTPGPAGAAAATNEEQAATNEEQVG